MFPCIQYVYLYVYKKDKEMLSINPIMCSVICERMKQKIDWWGRIKQHSIDLTLINTTGGSIGTPWSTLCKKL